MNKKIIIGGIAVIVLLLGIICYFIFSSNKDVTITFNTQYEKSLANIEVKKGEKASLPTLTRDGYDFLGWYVNDQKIDDNYTFNESTTLVAKWKETSYTITFNTDDGTDIDSITFTCGSTFTAPSNPEKSGYTFMGWQYENGRPIENGDVLECMDINLTAIWEEQKTNPTPTPKPSPTPTPKIEKTYTLTYDTVGAGNVSSVKFTCGDKFVAPKGLTKEGYYLAYWVDENRKIVNHGSVLECRDIKVTANWIANGVVTPEPRVTPTPVLPTDAPIAYKPVLYLYPEKKTNITVTFDKPELLTTTYPKYINSWKVTAYPDGSLYDKNGKYYYGLYWEAISEFTPSFNEGFYVESKGAINFLEEKLTFVGLSDKERNEFIMYWLPILEKNEKNLVYFELTEERNIHSKLNITPQPDSLLRVFIHVKKVNEKTNIKEQKLTTFERNGFVAVEWGGSTY